MGDRSQQKTKEINTTGNRGMVHRSIITLLHNKEGSVSERKESIGIIRKMIMMRLDRKLHRIDKNT
jgi:hypothetical protein